MGNFKEEFFDNKETPLVLKVKIISLNKTNIKINTNNIINKNSNQKFLLKTKNNDIINRYKTMSKKIIKIALLSLLAFFIGFFLVSRKENLDLDEIYTYGLANSSFQLEVEDFKEYSGEELLSAYAMVKPTERFDIKNVFFNQEMDTHPPLYYMLVNIVCSFNAGSFSMWYGLIINVILLVLLFWEMRYLFTLIIKDNIFSTIFTLLSFFLYGFTNEIVFTRMYVMLTVVSMAFIILVIDYIKGTLNNSLKGTSNNSVILGMPLMEHLKVRIFKNKFLKYSLIRGSINILNNNISEMRSTNSFIIRDNIKNVDISMNKSTSAEKQKNNFIEKNVNDKVNIDNINISNSIHLSSRINISFIIKFYIICIIGILTQYHFMIIAGFFSFILAIHLIKNRNIKMLIVIFVVGVLSILTSHIIFPGMLTHFFGGASLHALTNNQNAPFLQKFIEMAETLKEAFFGDVGIIIYGIIIVICLVMLFIQKFKSTKKYNDESKNDIENQSLKYYFYFLLCCIVYFILIVVTVQFTFMRYLYNIYPLILILLLSPVYIVLKNIKKAFAVVSLILLLALCIMSNFKSQADSLNIGDEIFHQYLIQNKNKKVICLYHSVDKYGNENTMGGTSKWKLPYPLYLLRDMENVTFVDTGYIKKLKMSTSKSICGYDDIFLVIYTTQDDNTLINEVMIKNNVTKIEKTYFTNYIHIYHLHN